MSGHAVLTDTTGTAYVTAERRYHLFELCDRLRLDRRAIRWSADLRCYALAVRTTDDKQAVRQYLNTIGKGGDKHVQNSMRMRERRSV